MRLSRVFPFNKIFKVLEKIISVAGILKALLEALRGKGKKDGK